MILRGVLELCDIIGLNPKLISKYKWTGEKVCLKLNNHKQSQHPLEWDTHSSEPDYYKGIKALLL